jgi:hypothetical protein
MNTTAAVFPPSYNRAGDSRLVPPMLVQGVLLTITGAEAYTANLRF